VEEPDRARAGPVDDLDTPAADAGEASDQVRARVEAARALQLDRAGKPNQALTPSELRDLMTRTRDLGMEPVVEAANAAEVVNCRCRFFAAEYAQPE